MTSDPLNFIRPRSTRLMEIAIAVAYPKPTHCEMHVGEHDWQANPLDGTKFAQQVGIDVHVVEDAGHIPLHRKL